MLLKEKGYLISEEYNYNSNNKNDMDKETLRWFFESMDLLEMSNMYKYPYSPHNQTVNNTKEDGKCSSSGSSSSSSSKRGHKKNQRSVSDSINNLFG